MLLPLSFPCPGLEDLQVVANTVAALTDIHNAATAAGSDEEIFVITGAVLTKLLIALNECSEWGRVAILNALSRYKTVDDRESEHICERVVPQFQHANASVVLAAVKVRFHTSAGLGQSSTRLGDHDSYA